MIKRMVIKAEQIANFLEGKADEIPLLVNCET